MEWTVLPESLSKFESLFTKNIKVQESKENVSTSRAVRTEIIFQDAVSSVSTPIHAAVENTAEFQESVVDIVADVVAGKTPSAETIARFKLVSGFRSSNLFQDLLCDSLWFWGTQCAAGSPEWSRLCAFIKDLCGTSATGSLVDTSKLKVGLDINLLVGAGVLQPDENRVQRTLIKFNTGMLYQQQKYNLMREETEGYAKLAVALSHLPCSSHSHCQIDVDITATTTAGTTEQADVHINHIFALVGQFDLDPNRVLDIILDAFEQQPWNNTFIRLLRNFKQSNIASIVGLKFVNYHADSLYNKTTTSTESTPLATPVIAVKTNAASAAVSAVDEKVTDNTSAASTLTMFPSPSSLYTLAATLLVHDLIRMDQLFAYLEPSLDDMVTRMRNNEKEMRSSIVKYGVVSLTATSGTGNGTSQPQQQSQNQSAAVPPAGRPPLPPLPRTAPPATGSSSSGGTTAPPSKSDSVSVAATPSTATPSVMTTVNVEEEWNEDFFQSTTGIAPPASALAEDGNQVTGLLAALLSLRGWDQALPLLKILRERKVDIMRCVHVKHALVALLAWRLDTLYDTVSPRRLALSRPAEYTCNNRIGNSIGGNVSTKSSSPLSSVIDLYTRAARAAGLSQTDGGLLSSAAGRGGVDSTHSLALQFSPHQCLPFIDLHSLPLDAAEMLSYISHHIGQNAAVFTQLCRLLKAHRDDILQVPAFSLTAADDMARKEFYMNLDATLLLKLEPMLEVIATVLLPALSVSEGNAFLASQVWAIIAPLPFAHRFALYDCWRGNGFAKDALSVTAGGHAQSQQKVITTPIKPLEVVYAEVKVLHVCKGYIKRLSKENTRTVGRQLARLTHGCPLPVFNHILSQIEVFDNLIPVVVEALRYSTEMSRDALAGLLLTQLQKDGGGGSGEGSKLKKGDTHYTDWFAALSKFISTYYARYPETEIKGVLHYLLKRLQMGQSLDLLVLRDLLGKMGRCETLIEVSAQQLESLAGGRVLRTEMMAAVSGSGGGSLTGGAGVGGSKPVAVGVLSPEASRKGVRLLREELITSGTAVPLLLYLAQVRSRILHCTDTPHLKLISHLFDTAQDVLMQFTDFLVGAVPPVGRQMQHMAQLMPSLSSLVCDSGLSVSIAFQLVRPIVRAALVASSSVSGDESSSGSSGVPEYLRQWHPFSAKMRKVVTEYYSPPMPISTEGGMDFVADGDVVAVGENTINTAATNASTTTTTNIWTLISPDLVIAFWSLTLSDLSCPHERYAIETRRLRDKYAELDKLSSGGSGGGLVDEKTAKLRRTEATRLLSSIKDLNDEYEAHKKHVENVRQHLLIANKNTFISERGRMDVQLTTEVLLQVCVLERVLMSPADAIYAVQFFLLLHSLDTPGFSSLTFMNKFIQTVVPLVFCTTEVEAGFLGYALAELLKTVNLYLVDKEVFKEASLKCGFAISGNSSSVVSTTSATTINAATVPPSEDVTTATTILDGNSSAPTAGHIIVTQHQHLTYDKWTKVTKHFSKNLTTILHNALNSSEYMHLRSALLLLSRIAGEYPTTTSVGVPLLLRVEAVATAQSALNRGDLALAAKSVGAMLKRQMTSGAWVNDDLIATTPSSVNKTSKSTKTHNTSITDVLVVNTKKSDSKNRSTATSSSSISKSSSAASLSNRDSSNRDREVGSSFKETSSHAGQSDKKRPHADIAGASSSTTSSASRGGGSKENRDRGDPNSSRESRDRGSGSSSGSSSSSTAAAASSTSVTGDHNRGSGGRDNNNRDRDNKRMREDRPPAPPLPLHPPSQQSLSQSQSNSASSASGSGNNNSKRDQDRERDQKQRERDRERFSKNIVTAVLTLPPVSAAPTPSTTSKQTSSSSSSSSDKNKKGESSSVVNASSVEVINSGSSKSASSQSSNNNRRGGAGDVDESRDGGKQRQSTDDTRDNNGNGNSGKRNRMMSLLHSKSQPTPPSSVSNTVTSGIPVVLTDEQRLRQTLMSSMLKSMDSKSSSQPPLLVTAIPVPPSTGPVITGGRGQSNRGPQAPPPLVSNSNSGGRSGAAPLPPPPLQQPYDSRHGQQQQQRSRGGSYSQNAPQQQPPQDLRQPSMIHPPSSQQPSRGQAPPLPLAPPPRDINNNRSSQQQQQQSGSPRGGGQQNQGGGKRKR